MDAGIAQRGEGEEIERWNGEDSYNSPAPSLSQGVLLERGNDEKRAGIFQLYRFVFVIWVTRNVVSSGTLYSKA